MKTAIYHQPDHLQDVELFIAKENEDGTLDLANKEGEAVVTGCPVVEDPAPGCCTIKTSATASKQSGKK